VYSGSDGHLTGFGCRMIHGMHCTVPCFVAYYTQISINVLYFGVNVVSQSNLDAT